MSFKKVIRNLELSCSDSTLRRFLKSYSYRRYRAKKKPKLVDRNRLKRLAFARAHVN
jgi:hypothetical protein